MNHLAAFCYTRNIQQQYERIRPLFKFDYGQSSTDI